MPRRNGIACSAIPRIILRPGSFRRMNGIGGLKNYNNELAGKAVSAGVSFILRGKNCQAALHEENNTA